LLFARRVLTSAARASVKSLVAVWLGYPLVMAGLAASKEAAAREPTDAPLADNPDATGTGDPMVSVIIATRDDEAVVRSRIADCLRCTYPPDKLEVVVAVDRQSCEHAGRYLSRVADSASPEGRCTIVLGDHPGGKAAALNAAVRAARGQILVFTDTRQRFQPDAIRHLVDALQEPRVGAVSGSLELPRANGSSPLIGRYWSLERWLRRCEARVHSSVGVSGSIWATRRSFWAPLPSDLILDDLYTPMRIALGGHRVAFAEAARAVETRQAQGGHEYRRKVRTLTGVIQLCAWQPAVLVPLRNPIWLQFVAHKLLRLFTPYWVMAIGAWMGSLAMRWVVANPRVAGGLAPAVVAGVYARRGMVQRLWNAVRSALTLQAAVIVATYNGVRRRWRVW
jgi:cellulose synthase/poly-beta-1,6-N-acetylglucosamine synthase-like glycosyltransferase